MAAIGNSEVKVCISNQTREKLAQEAARHGRDIAQYAAELIEQAVAHPLETLPDFEQWSADFNAWMGEVDKRASRYPPGYVVDDSRESIYAERDLHSVI